MKKTVFLKQIFSFFLLFCVANLALAEVTLPTRQGINSQLEEAKSNINQENGKLLVQHLEATLGLLDNIDAQNQLQQTLNKTIADAPQLIAKSNSEMEALRAQNNDIDAEKLIQKPLSELQALSESISNNLQMTQEQLVSIAKELSLQAGTSSKMQATLIASQNREQELKKLLLNAQLSNALKTQYATELELLKLQDNYSQSLLKNNDLLISLYTNQQDVKLFHQKVLQDQLSQLQDVINQKRLTETKQQIEQEQKSHQANPADNNPIVVSELDVNFRLNQDLIAQTEQLNKLSQDNLRIKSVLDDLQRTQNSIDEQISSLQGTLLLSRLINKQRQSLPQGEEIKGLGNRIANLRLQIFNTAEMRDNLLNTDAYFKSKKIDPTQLTVDDKNKLNHVLLTRQKIISEISGLLNEQLNLLINVELNQQQVSMISRTLQQKLQQQSFWVQSTVPINLAWLTNFPKAASAQLAAISEKIDFANWRDNLLPASLLVSFLLLITGIILWSKAAIKKRLSLINNRVNTMADNQWNTPVAIFWTLILCLPSTFAFLSVLILLTYIGFANPLELWPWSLRMSGYWLFFNFMLAILRPNGIAYRHLGMPQSSSEAFRAILKKFIWVVVLLLNTSIFTHVEATGYINDVFGQLLTISMLLISIFVIGPRFGNAVKKYKDLTQQETTQKSSRLTKVFRLILFILPILLILLIAFGYYYTALILIRHIMSTYFVIAIWMVIKEIIYRMFQISFRRVTYRRLKLEKENAKLENINQQETESPIVIKEDEIDFSKMNTQVLQIVSLALWVGLFFWLYWVWQDLISVAYYLQGTTLWQQVVPDAGGNNIVESITLLNLLTAIIIIIVVYLLIKNIGGLLEVLIFSRISMPQGTPYTITTLSTYIIITIGAAWAFASLGFSWSKLQWLFAALSVGLGFGLQEIFANFVSGIIILFERPIRIGDTITIGTFTGTVSKIRIRATTLIDNDGKEVIVPNKAFVTERLVNWALTSSVTRLVIQVGVSYGSDLTLTKQLLLQAANDSKTVLKDPAPIAYFLNFGASTLDHELRVYVGQLSERLPTTDAINRRINELFAANNIDIAFNQVDVFIKNKITGDEIKITNN